MGEAGYDVVMLKPTACLVMLLGFAPYASADEKDEIVTTCHFANAEWGAEAIDRCVRENLAVREIVLAYPAEHRQILQRCRASSELGWNWVKNCVDRDIEAAAALASYPSEWAELIGKCKNLVDSRSAAKVKACVDHGIEASRTLQN